MGHKSMRSVSVTPAVAIALLVPLSLITTPNVIVTAFSPRLANLVPIATTVPARASPSDDVESDTVTTTPTAPKAEPSTRTRRRRSGTPRAPRSAANARAARTPTPVKRKRAPHQFDHTKEEARPFVNGKTEIAGQIPNEDAPPFAFPPTREPSSSSCDGDVIRHEHVSSVSLDELFPDLGISAKFASSGDFRTELRAAMRADVFDTTPAYHAMSDKARRMLLLPDSSLQGSWRCRDGRWVRKGEDGAADGEDDAVRMTALTRVLRDYLGDGAPSGDEFMDKIGSLCGSEPSTHWIDIVGVLDRRIPHSWHLDTGRSRNGDTKTVLLGFPPEDEYDGVGVFSHVVKLERERHANEDHPPSEPVVFNGLEVDGKYIVRPRFCEGREIICYRDIDVLHSSPDVAYRASVMRFM